MSDQPRTIKTTATTDEELEDQFIEYESVYGLEVGDKIDNKEVISTWTRPDE